MCGQAPSLRAAKRQEPRGYISSRPRTFGGEAAPGCARLRRGVHCTGAVVGICVRAMYETMMSVHAPQQTWVMRGALGAARNDLPMLCQAAAVGLLADRRA